MSKYERQTYRMILGTMVIMAVAMLAEAIIRETECCPKGGQVAFAICLLLCYAAWPTTPDR